MLMTFYEKLTRIIEEEYLNTELGGSFNISYLNNTDSYNPDNLIFDSQCGGVTRLVSTTTNNLSDTGSENRIDIMQLELLIPLGTDKTTFFRNKIINLLHSLTAKKHQIDDTELLITSVNLIQDIKYPSHFNGVEYEDIIIQFTIDVTVDFIYSNEGILTVDNTVVDCKASVVLQANKMLNGEVYNNSDKVQRPRSTGIQYSFDVTLTYNKNNKMHASLLSDWLMTSNHQVTYTLDKLKFSRTCQVTSYTLNAVTADTIKLRIVFQEAEADLNE